MMKDRLKFLIVFYVWMFISIPLALIFKIFNIDTSNYFTIALAQFIIEVLMTTFVLCFYSKTIKKDFKEAIKTKGFIGEVLKLYVGVLVVSISSSIVMNSIADILHISLLDGSENNKLVQLLLKSAPTFMVIGTIFLAPFYEEGIMRLGLKKGIKNKKVFAIISGFIFGIIHVVDNPYVYVSLPLLAFTLDYIWSSKHKKKYMLSTICVINYLVLNLSLTYLTFNKLAFFANVNDMIYSILYVSIGIYFAIIYLKKQNIFYSICTHMIVNTLATIVLFFT